MKKMKIKKGDMVLLVSGKRQERGKKGKVTKVLFDKNRVVVEKVNMIKEYVRANPQKNVKGGIVEREGSVPISSVMYYCSECEQGVRLRYEISDNKKKRQCVKCSAVID